MDAPAGCCAFCGRRAAHAHHVTGRGTDHAYLRPSFTVDLCHQHHTLVHNDLRAQSIDNPLTGSFSRGAAAERSLLRIAAFNGRLAEYTDSPFPRRLAIALVEIAHDVNAMSNVVDWTSEELR